MWECYRCQLGLCFWCQFISRISIQLYMDLRFVPNSKISIALTICFRLQLTLACPRSVFWNIWDFSVLIWLSMKIFIIWANLIMFQKFVNLPPPIPFIPKHPQQPSCLEMQSHLWGNVLTVRDHWLPSSYCGWWPGQDHLWHQPLVCSSWLAVLWVCVHLQAQLVDCHNIGRVWVPGVRDNEIAMWSLTRVGMGMASLPGGTWEWTD